MGVFQASAASAFADDTYVHLTWERAPVVLPNGKHVALGDEAFRAYAKGGKLPVVVYFHGSSGLQQSSMSPIWVAYAKALRAVLIAPDSFARPNRSKHNSNLWIGERRNEIDYALFRLRQAPWADPGNIVAIGLSEGSLALVHYDKPGFRAVVLTGWHCQWVKYTIDLPNDIPVLNAQHGSDPNFYPRRGSGTCEDALKGRPNSEVFTWETPAIHNGNMVKEARVKIIEFLKRNMR